MKEYIKTFFVFLVLWVLFQVIGWIAVDNHVKAVEQCRQSCAEAAEEALENYDGEFVEGRNAEPIGQNLSYDSEGADNGRD